MRELFELADRLGIGAPPFDSRWPGHQTAAERYCRGCPSTCCATSIRGRRSRRAVRLSRHPGGAALQRRLRSLRPHRPIGLVRRLRALVPRRRPGVLRLHPRSRTSARSGTTGPGSWPTSRSIDPAVSSEYVRSRYAQRRDRPGGGAGTGRETGPGRRRRRRTRSAGERRRRRRRYRRVCGWRRCCVSRKAEERGGRTALQWARLAAELGLPAAMASTAELLDGSGSADPAIHRRGRRMARLRTRPSGPSTRLGHVRRSSSYRVGTQLALLARSPRRNGRAATRELAADLAAAAIEG